MPSPTPEPKKALLISLSNIESDPRLRRQIDWLDSVGATIDTIGLGPHPTEIVRNHFAMVPQAPWVRSRLGQLVIYALMPLRHAFRLLVSNRIPIEAHRLVASGEYDIIVFNDYDIIAWTGDSRVFTPAALAAHLHLDLHEYREKRLKIDSAWRVLTRRYLGWTRKIIGSPVFTTRSTVASGIAELYVGEFGFNSPVIVRNSPPFFDQKPSPVDPDNVRLIFHGMASRARGLWEIVDAMPSLDQRFSATFMLTENKEVNADLAEYSRGIERVTIVPPAPMRELSAVVNQYDLEIMFYRPYSANLEFALPNKFFEAIQGRLGLVIGESPMMAEIVREYGNGAIVPGWEPSDLAATLNALTTEQIQELKDASDRASSQLNAEAEGRVFLRIVGAA